MKKIDPDIWRILPGWVNPVYYPWLFDKRRYNVFYGGASSGKSFFIAERIIYKIMSEPGHNYLVLRKVDRENRFSTFALILQVITLWGFGELFRVNKTLLTITCLLNGNQILFAGLDDREKIKSITFEKGILTDIWIEEATEIDYEDFKQLRLRLRGIADVSKNLTLSFNPISALHWAKKFFFDNPLPKEKCGVLKTTYLDNRFLTKDDKEEIERYKEEDETYYQIYALGNWGIIGNIVFHNYEIHDFDYGENDLENVFQGMDFGTAHASAIERGGFKDGELFVFDELYGKGWTNTDFMGATSERWGDDAKYWNITADSAEPDRIIEWNRANYRVEPAKKGPGSLGYGIDYLTRHKIHIHKTKCPNLAREVQTFKRREDKDGNPMDAFVEINDDCIAALRYGTEYIWNQYHGEIASWSPGELGL